MVRKRKILAIAVFATALGFSSAYSPNYNDSARALYVKEEVKPIRITLVGDLMLDRGVESSVNKNMGGDFSSLFENVSEIKNADISFANLEGPISSKGKNVGSKYSFRMDPKVLPALVHAGFDVFSFANNHAGDWSYEAFNETRSLLDFYGIRYSGAGENYSKAIEPVIFEKYGKKIGFISFTDVGPDWLSVKDNKEGILLANDENLEKVVKSAKEKVDYLLVSFHWGQEYKPINSRQKKLAYNVIDNGADVVVGHHPHVIQTTELYKNKPIFYSLGNFIFDQYFSDETMKGMLVDLTISESGEISFKKKTVVIDKFFKPQIPREYSDSDAVLSLKRKSFSCPDSKEEANKYFLVSLPSKNITLEKYIPQKLVKVSHLVTGGQDICLTEETYNAYKKMRSAMLKDDVDAHILSGWRDKSMQENNVKERNALAAPVGQSEHHLGTAIDFTSGTVPVKFEKSPEYEWMLENAYKYGFVQSYRSDAEGVNNYGGEPWHWRYVGKDLAKEIKEQNIQLNDYLNLLE